MPVDSLDFFCTNPPAAGRFGGIMKIAPIFLEFWVVARHAGGLVWTSVWFAVADLFPERFVMKHILLASLVSLGLVSSAQAGMITNLSFTDAATHFESTWLWTLAGGTYEADAVTVTMANWTVTLQGFKNGRLRDTSTHLTNPHFPPEIAPNTPSYFDYPMAALGVGPVITFWEHPAIPGHYDLFTLQTSVGSNGIVTIDFSGEHIFPDPQGDLRHLAPEPSTFALLGIGGIALVGYGWRRKRQQAA